MEDAKENESKDDEVDWRLAELIVNIQYACQRYFFVGQGQDQSSDS